MAAASFVAAAESAPPVSAAVSGQPLPRLVLVPVILKASAGTMSALALIMAHQAETVPKQSAVFAVAEVAVQTEEVLVRAAALAVEPLDAGVAVPEVVALLAVNVAEVWVTAILREDVRLRSVEAVRVAPQADVLVHNTAAAHAGHAVAKPLNGLVRDIVVVRKAQIAPVAAKIQAKDAVVHTAVVRMVRAAEHAMAQACGATHLMQEFEGAAVLAHAVV